MTTTMVEKTDEPLAYANGEPDINELQEEYTLAWSQDPDSMARIAQCEDIRYSRWPGQCADGLKHQELMPEGIRALPYDRAPDTRVMLCDQIIQALVDVDYASFWNARVKVAPAAASRLSAAQTWELRALISWMIHGPLRVELIDDVEFASQVQNTIGWVVLHPCWRQDRQMRMQKVSFDDLAAMAEQAPPGSLANNLPAIIKDPALEDQAVEVAMMMIPGLRKSAAREVIEDLRDKGQAEYPAAEPVSNVPEISVLVPWQDFILPAEA